MERELVMAKQQLEVPTNTGDEASGFRIKELEEEVENLRVASKTLADRYKLGQMVRPPFIVLVHLH